MRPLRLFAALWLTVGLTLNILVPSGAAWSWGVYYYGWPFPVVGFQGWRIFGPPPNGMVIPELAIALAVLLGPPALLFLLDRRLSRNRAAGRCRACRYDLRGTPGPTCPECGSVVMPHTDENARS